MNKEIETPQPEEDKQEKGPVQAEENSKAIPRNDRSGRNKALARLTFALLLLGISSFLYWFYFVRFRVSTDDAYVAGNSVMVMAPEAGIATIIYADNTDYVELGQPLVQLDKTLFELEFERAKVNLSLATRQVRQLQETVNQRKADVALQKANLIRARQDFEDRSKANIQEPAAISKEDLTHAKAALDAAEASFNLAQHQLDSAVASLGNTKLEEHPTILNAEVALRQAYVNLYRTRILAPASGFVARRNVQVGERVTTSRALMSIIPLDEIWIDANFKETQLRDIRINQPAIVTSDIYGSAIKFHGRVAGIEAGTGSIFSLLPAQNATGNWIKIVQRVPVRIYLNADELKKYPLFLGLSTYVIINTSNLEGQRLTEVKTMKPKFTTPVYDIPMQPVNELIQQIVSENLNIYNNFY